MKKAALTLLFGLAISGCAKQVETKTTTVNHTTTVTRTVPKQIVRVPPRTITVKASPPKPKPKPPVYSCTVVRGQKICDIPLPVDQDGNIISAGLGRYSACAPQGVQATVPLSVTSDSNPTTDVIVWCDK